MARRIRVISLIGVLGALVCLVAPSPVAAECSQLDRWPSFTDAARSARVIVIGEVVASYDDDSADNAIRFEFRVDEVLRGRSEDTLEFRDAVTSGLPLTICPGDSILRVKVGDHLAMAFGARYHGVDGPVTAIGFLDSDPDPFLMPRMERLTREQVHSVAALPDTDTESAGAETGGATPLGVVLAGLIGGLFAYRRTRLRPSQATPGYPWARWPSSSRPSVTSAASGTKG